jgi:tetratricopeptide (TPR) repeat protein
LEQGYAASNIGIVQLRRHGEADQAARSFKAAISYFEDAQKRLTDSSPARREVANNWAWLADAEKLRGNYAAALADREHEAQLIAAMLRDNPRDMLALDVNSRNHVAVARIKLAQGQAAEALELLEKAHQEQAVLVATDPSNALNNAQLRMIELFQVRSKLSLPIALRPSSQALRASLGSCSTMPHELEVTVMCEILDARILAATDRETAAKRLADMARRYWPPGSNRLSATWGLDYEAEAALALKI